VSDAGFDRAHFEAIRALDVANVMGSEDRSIYLAAYLSSIGVPEDQLDGAIDTVVPLWNGPSPDLWQRVLSGSIDGLRALYDANLRLGIVSNSDGRAEEALVLSEICQVGPGEGVPVLAIVDSDIVGVAKPDPAIFQFALPTLGLDPSDVVYVGDSVKYDVRSAEAAGMTPLHVDPFGLCDGVDHAHVTGVNEVLHYMSP
jgi:putative hydrolase of the HAD superfamily